MCSLIFSIQTVQHFLTVKLTILYKWNSNTMSLIIYVQLLLGCWKNFLGRYF